MGNVKEISFSELSEVDLHIDALYKGGNSGNAGDDPISKLIGCGNQGGFRYVGSLQTGIKLCVLYSSLADIDWPDSIDPDTGIYTYFGDNKSPGHEIHETRRKGNIILRDSFNSLHSGNREDIPPFFIFNKGPTGRDVYFKGLCVPGAPGISNIDELVAIWRTKEGQRFQNYRSLFTILDEPIIKRAWLNEIHNGNEINVNTPKTWKKWRDTGDYSPLIAPRNRSHRTKQEQLPDSEFRSQIIQKIIDYFKNHPMKEYAFEKCAAKLAQMMDSNITECDLTRPWRDGGRDATGKYRIGTQDNAIEVEFALEAKCKIFTSGSGVKETSRLISRLRYRQFGIFVTTSYVYEQAYKEIIEDGHPVIIVSGKDIAELLINHGINTEVLVNQWLAGNFPYEGWRDEEQRAKN